MKKNFFNFLKSHKIIIAAIIIAVGGGCYYYQSKSGVAAAASYVLGKVEKGSIIVSVSGTGQVSASNQIDIKPKVAGDIINVAVKNGQEVKEGDIIVQIKSDDARKAARDAQTALETARLELSKLQAPPEEIEILQAENALSAAKNNLADLINPDKSTIAQTKNSLTAAQDSLAKLKLSQTSSYRIAVDAQKKAEDDLSDAYEDALNAVDNAFLDLPTLITGIRDTMYSYDIADSEITLSDSWNISSLMNSILSADTSGRDKLQEFIGKAESDYQAARAKYDANYDNYKNTGRSSSRTTIEKLSDETLETVTAMSEAAKSENNMLDYWVDYRSQNNLNIYSTVSAYQADLKTHISKINSHLSSLLTIQRTIDDGKKAIIDAADAFTELKQSQPLDLAAAQRSVEEKEDALGKLKNPCQYDIDAAQMSVKEKELALENLKTGAGELDIRAKKIAIQQKADALSAEQRNLADYDVRAPFDGVIAEVSAKKGDSASSGSAFATLITKQKIAEITLNEVDAAKIKAGQKAIITFNAIDGLSITGEAAEVDNIGTVSQGVVSYNVKIIFDTQDERVKPQMSVSADLITDQKIDVLIVPNSAVKTDNNGSSYVEIVDAAGGQETTNGIIPKNPLQRKTIEIGLSNNISTEIISGLSESDQIAVRTVSANSTAQTQNSSGFQMLGGGAMRMAR